MSRSRSDRPRFLVTGFDPFGGESLNPSFETVRLLDGDRLGVDLHKLEVPTRFGTGARTLLDEIDRLRPDFVLCMGQAGGRSRICLEKAALNIRAASIPDNAGYRPAEEPAISGAPAAYLNDLDLYGLTARLNADAPVCQVSYFAGTFVCNELYFSLLHRVNTVGDCRGLFVHVPYLPAQVRDERTPSMPQETILSGTERLIRSLADMLRADLGNICI